MCWFYDGNSQRLTKSGFMEKPGIEPATSGLQDIGLSPTLRRLLKLFAAFLGINQFRRVGLRFVRWFYCGNTQWLTESSFMEKPEIEPATSGLQDIGLSPTLRRLLILFAAFLGINQFRRVGLRFVRWFYCGNTQWLTESSFMEKPGIEPATSGLQDIGLSPTLRRLLKLFAAFLGINQFRRVGLRLVRWFYCGNT